MDNIHGFTCDTATLKHNIAVWEQRLGANVSEALYEPEIWARVLLRAKLQDTLCERAKALYIVLAGAILSNEATSSFVAEAAAYAAARVMSDVYRTQTPPDYWRVVEAVGYWLQVAPKFDYEPSRTCELAWKYLQLAVRARKAARAA